MSLKWKGDRCQGNCIVKPGIYMASPWIQEAEYTHLLLFPPLLLLLVLLLLMFHSQVWHCHYSQYLRCNVLYSRQLYLINSYLHNYLYLPFNSLSLTIGSGHVWW